MIYFDELSYAEEMHDSMSFIKSYSKVELTIYAKWLKYKKCQDIGKDVCDLTEEEIKNMDAEIEKELIYFSENCYPDFNYTVNYKDIDGAIKKCDVHRLKVPSPIVITKNEWETIMSVEKEECRKVLFVMLVDAKYNHENSVSIVKRDYQSAYWNRMNPTDILKTAKVKYKGKAGEFWVWYEICTKLDLIGTVHTKDGTRRFVKFADSNSDTLIKVTDYDNISMYYEKLNGENIGECKYCGRLFKQNKFNNADYCYKHRRYQKVGLRFDKCVDCGNEFHVSATNQKKIRCDECQKKYNKKYQIEYQKKLRESINKQK